MRAPGRGADRSQTRGVADSLHGECGGRSHAFDEAGGAQRQARGAVYAAGVAEVAAEGFAAGRSSAGDSRIAQQSCAGAGECVETVGLAELTNSSEEMPLHRPYGTPQIISAIRVPHAEAR